MGQPAEKRRRATYADLEAVPPGKVAELIDGQLYVFPRPAFPHLNAEGSLNYGTSEILFVEVPRERPEPISGPSVLRLHGLTGKLQHRGDLRVRHLAEVDPSDQHGCLCRHLGEDNLHDPLPLGAVHPLLDVRLAPGHLVQHNPSVKPSAALAPAEILDIVLRAMEKSIVGTFLGTSVF